MELYKNDITVLQLYLNLCKIAGLLPETAKRKSIRGFLHSIILCAIFSTGSYAFFYSVLKFFLRMDIYPRPVMVQLIVAACLKTIQQSLIFVGLNHSNSRKNDLKLLEHCFQLVDREFINHVSFKTNVTYEILKLLILALMVISCSYYLFQLFFIASQLATYGLIIENLILNFQGAFLTATFLFFSNALTKRYNVLSSYIKCPMSRKEIRRFKRIYKKLFDCVDIFNHVLENVMLNILCLVYLSFLQAIARILRSVYEGIHAFEVTIVLYPAMLTVSIQ